MVCLSTQTRTEILQQIEMLEGLLSDAYVQFSSAINKRSKKYVFDSGEGSQSETFVSLEEMRSNIDYLESRIAFLKRRLCGKLIFNMNTRIK